MVNTKRLITDEELKVILANHKIWLDTKGEEGVRADLSLVDRRYNRLNNINLPDVNLRHTNLSNPN